MLSFLSSFQNCAKMSTMDREGGDITAADMVSPVTEPSNIEQYFVGATVFVTGGTGFLGRLLIEKLLRTCDEVKKIYVLVRPKKDKSGKERFRDYFDDPLYERLKRERAESIHKLHMLEGDCGLPGLGLSEYDHSIITSEVKCIFHCAATVRFDEKIRTAVHINVRGTREILQLAKKVVELKSIVYVSTAYSFCPKRRIDELFYEPTISWDKLLTLVETLDDRKLEEIVPTLIGEWPNTYTFTKSVAEDVIRKESADLPIAIVRPSIVMGTAKEPVAGWINNFYGATGIFVGAALGLIRTLHCEPNNLADMVPADYVVNSILAAAWDIANAKGSNLNLEVIESHLKAARSAIPIYNYVSAPQRPITWLESTALGNRHVQSIPSPLQVWHYTFRPNPNKHVHLFFHYTLHLFPAYVVDFLASIVRKKPQLVKGYKKIEKFLNAIAYFSSQQWFFQNNNTQQLWSKLNNEDRKLFEFDMSTLDWDLFFHTMTRGARVYLLKDPLDTIPQGSAKRFKLTVAHYVLVGVLLLGVFQFFMLIYRVVF